MPRRIHTIDDNPRMNNAERPLDDLPNDELRAAMAEGMRLRSAHECFKLARRMRALLRYMPPGSSPERVQVRHLEKILDSTGDGLAASVLDR